MSRDYKSRKSSASRGGKGSKGTLILGIFIGYTLGIVSAIGIWFYLEQAPSPFLTEEQISDYDRTFELSSKNADEQSAAPTEEQSNPAKNNEKTQFDYHTILSTHDQPVSKYEAPQQIEKPKEKREQLVVTKPQPLPAQRTQERSIQSPVTETYYLQVGSFRNNADADNLKARLALMGMVASVQSVDLSEKGVWHRVRVGPFALKNQVDNAHNTLRENGIETQLIKVR